MIKPKGKMKKWNGTTHGLCPDCLHLLNCVFPRSEKHLELIVTQCNEYVMELRETDYDIILMDNGEIYVR